MAHGTYETLPIVRQNQMEISSFVLEQDALDYVVDSNGAVLELVKSGRPL
jgi:hypothetical protein